MKKFVKFIVFELSAFEHAQLFPMEKCPIGNTL